MADRNVPAAPADSGAHLFARRPIPSEHAEPIVVTAGQGNAEIGGTTNVCLQAAVDYVARLGGGIVRILPGRYTMYDSLHLRPRVTVRGSGRETVLVKAGMITSKLSADLGYGHYDVSLAEPDRFEIGMGIHIQDDRSAGFYTTCATLTYRKGDIFGISRFLNHDYSRGANGLVRTLYPVISGYGAEDAAVEDLAIDGNSAQNDYLNGCRGGGIFLLQAHRAHVRGVVITNYNGDGISFQQCEDILLEDCVTQGNTGFGFHPGSGSTRPIMRRLVARRNGSDGLFYCLRVSFGVLEDSEFTDNGGHGLSIGGRDTDQIIRRCVVKRNGGCGVYFRQGDEAMAGSRATIEACTLEANCRKSGEAEVHLDAALSDICLIGNTIIPGSTPAILIGKDVRSVVLKNNQVTGAEAVKDMRQ